MQTDSAFSLSHARLHARTAGLLYLYIIVAGVLGESLVRGGVIDFSAPLQTLQAIEASQIVWRAHIFFEILVLCCDVGIAVLLYVLLKPAGHVLSLAAAFFRLAMIGVSGVKTLFLLVPLLFIGDGSWFAGFNQEQAAGVSVLFLRLHALTFSISLIFFGFCCVAKGWLILRAIYLPSFLGAFLAIAGGCYLVNSAVNILMPDYSSFLFPWILLPCLIAELALALWLLIRGIDAEKLAAQPGQAKPG
ncbi:MAG: hypothetical protein CMK06_01505 [Ponticaulis sp.]|nr:hypothetical protein [Ponticaulis sp.]|tara:strand:- start:148 stop:888 length:741 start_codon:yes stop_codon:yes gene_type:complete